MKTKDLRRRFCDRDSNDVHKLLIFQARFQLLIRIDYFEALIFSEQ
jgi:hypothetical protein